MTEGPSERIDLSGDWLYRADPRDVGLHENWAATDSADGWTPATVPSAWNASDLSVASDKGSVGWYRRDFDVPAGTPESAWTLRFEGVNYAATVFVNGAKIGSHAGMGTPFELPLPALRPGSNRLAVRVDNRPLPAGIHGPLRFRYLWNFGGILREVYLEPAAPIEIRNVLARPELGCPRCPARVRLRATLANGGVTPAGVRVTAQVGTSTADLGATTVAPGASAALNGQVTIAEPRRWSPADPYLYTVDFSAQPAGGGPAVSYRTHVGLRSIATRHGRLMLNGRPLRLRGVGLQEDWPDTGPVLTPSQRTADFALLHDLGVNVIRVQFPLHPAALEAADRMGILVWEDIPMGELGRRQLAQPRVLARARAYIKELIARDQNHPSIFVWSVGDEYEQRDDPPDAVLSRFLASTTSLVRRLDPSRLVGTETAMLGQRKFAGYRRLDAIGLNTFPVRGMYGRLGTRHDRQVLSKLLREQRRRYPRQVLIVTESGAETIRRPHGRGGTAEQSRLLGWQLPLYERSRELSGEMVWVLRDFAVRPNWLDTGQPLDTKGLVSFTGRRRPAFSVVARVYARPGRSRAFPLAKDDAPGLASRDSDRPGEK